jgi:hypothetical protein
MEPIYLVCAAVGGTLIVCQFVMTLLGIGGEHDVGGHDVAHDFGGHDVGGHDAAAAHHDVAHEGYSAWFFGMLTFRTLSAAVAFFGLTGLALREVDPVPRVILSVMAGMVAIFIVGSLMRLLYKLNLDATARIERTVGSRGTVYLSVPGKRAGTGKVMISHLNRTIEYKAVTSQDNLPTGANVVVVGIAGPDTVEVAPATSLERTSP